MKRLLTLGLMVFPVAALAAADPVSVYPPVPGGSLSQSLPSVVSGGGSTAPTVPPPALVSRPTWGAPACAPQPRYFAPQPLFAPRIRHSVAPCATGCGSRGSLLERLRAWLCGGAGPANNPGLVFAPPVIPLRDWFPHEGHITGAEGAAGWPSKCDGSRGRLFPMGGWRERGAPDNCPPAAGPRPIQIPFPYAVDRTVSCGQARPGLLRRLLAFLTPHWMNGENCEPAPQNVYGVPVAGTHSTAAAQPVVSGGGSAGGYHFATTPTVTSPPVRLSYAATVAPVPTTATQPFTVQR